MANLIPPTEEVSSTLIQLEASGCLSECGEGPNVEVVVPDGRSSILYKGINDADSARDLLKDACDILVPPILVAAVNVMARADKTHRIEEKEKMVTSVIHALERDESAGMNSHALASAFVMRADARLELAMPNVEGALADSRRAAAIDPGNGRVWRVLAESEEASGNLDNAVAAVRKWGQIDPESATKAAKESDRLNSDRPRP